MSQSFIWRRTTLADLPTLVAIADIVHPTYPEESTLFMERLALYPEGCLTLDCDAATIGYIVSHPWLYGDLPKLNSMLGALPAEPTSYYIHDIALLPEARGVGAAAQAIGLLTAQAKQRLLPSISLTAVNGSVGFWRHLGFRIVTDTSLDTKLSSYDADARFMVRDIS